MSDEEWWRNENIPSDSASTKDRGETGWQEGGQESVDDSDGDGHGDDSDGDDDSGDEEEEPPVDYYSDEEE